MFSNRGTTTLDAPEPIRASAGPLKRRAAVTEMPLRADSPLVNSTPEDFSEDSAHEPEFTGRARRPGIRLSFRGGLIPTTLWGRIAAGFALLLLTGAAIAGGMEVREYVLHDERFLIPNSDSIQIAGSSHLTRAQLLSVFGGDVDRNIFRIPLAQRRSELESLPWVAHATVMRLLPNHIRVSIVERTPVAFVRQDDQIALVDANGVVFDIPSPEMERAAGHNGGIPHYSFPVLSGISAGDPLSTRAARIKIYLDFLAALDASGEGISHKVSEVDVSNPEDVRAIIPDSGSDILVHFGQEKFLERYHQYRAHLAEWRTQYPKLASVDMRYERQVVLEMQPGSSTAPAAGLGSAVSGPKQEAAAPVSALAHVNRPVLKAKATKKAIARKMKPKGKPAGAASQRTAR